MSATEGRAAAPPGLESVLPQDVGQAVHMLHNIEALWFQDISVTLRPQPELLAAARADIRTLLKYALPAAYGEDQAVQQALLHTSLWREAHDALVQVTTTDAEDHDGIEVAAARLEAAHGALRAHNLLATPPVERQLQEGVVTELLQPPPPVQPEVRSNGPF